MLQEIGVHTLWPDATAKKSPVAWKARLVMGLPKLWDSTHNPLLTSHRRTCNVHQVERTNAIALAHAHQQELPKCMYNTFMEGAETAESLCAEGWYSFLHSLLQYSWLRHEKGSKFASPHQ